MRYKIRGFPGGSDGESSCKAGNPGSIPGSERSPGEGNGYPPQCSHLGNSMDRGDWWATVHEVAKRWTQLSDFHFTFMSKGLTSFFACRYSVSPIFVEKTLLFP